MRFHMIAPDEIETYIQDERSLIIDLREQAEYNRRHIRSAVNIPYRSWKQYEEEKAFLKMLEEKNVILYCERGPTSFAVAKELAEKGIPVSVLVGGIKSYRGK